MRPSSSLSPGSANDGDCVTAPARLVSAIEARLMVPGATLGRTVTLPVAGLTGLPAAVTEEDFVAPVWVAGAMNGVGVRPQVGLWVVSDIRMGSGSTIVAANAAAARYWEGPGSSDINGDGQAQALACVGPISEP